MAVSKKMVQTEVYTYNGEQYTDAQLSAVLHQEIVSIGDSNIKKIRASVGVKRGESVATLLRKTRAAHYVKVWKDLEPFMNDLRIVCPALFE